MYLLDTHTLLWARLEPTKLTSKHRDILRSPTSKKYISSISIWEISLKFALGKLDLGGHTLDEFLATALTLGFQVASPEPSHFASFYRLQPFEGHRDSFDRMLVWQAIQSRATLMSYDKK